MGAVCMGLKLATPTSNRKLTSQRRSQRLADFLASLHATHQRAVDLTQLKILVAAGAINHGCKRYIMQDVWISAVEIFNFYRGGGGPLIQSRVSSVGEMKCTQLLEQVSVRKRNRANTCSHWHADRAVFYYMV